MTWEKPHNDLPFLPPKVELESSAVLKKVALAHKALGELKGMTSLIPNQLIFLQVIGLQEAKLSSEIENVVTTHDKLYRALDNKELADPATKEVLRYKDALWLGYDWLKKKKRPLNTALFEKIGEALTKSKGCVRTMPGTKLVNSHGQAVYIPPEGKTRLRDMLANLEQFIYCEDSLDPLVKLGVIHYQFEAIHPFYDGNGRTGRILNILYLIEMNLISLPVLYLSGHIIAYKPDYYRLLQKVTQESSNPKVWEEWTFFMLDAVIQTAQKTQEKICLIQSLIEKTEKLIHEKLPKIYSKDLVNLLFSHPYCKITFLEKAGIAKRQTASLYLKKLEEARILICQKKGRDKYFINQAFLDILIAF